MKKTLALLALTAAFSLGAVHAQAQENSPPPPPPGEEGPGGHHRGEFFKDADTNNDGFLTREEMDAAQKKRMDKMFSHVDADNDGKLSTEELKKGREEMRQKMRARFEDRQKTKDVPKQ